jgi:CheY-like chemotaxis protein
MNDIDLTGNHILLVEDEYLIAESLRSLLEGWGATVIGPVATNESALALLAKTDRVDFGVVDVNLRGTRAFPVAEALLARSIPFVFATGYETSMIPERFPGVAILQKPFSDDQIAGVLLPLADARSESSPVIEPDIGVAARRRG